MKKNVFLIAFIGLFLIIGLTLSMGILIAGPSEAGANERLSQSPALFHANGKWNDQFLSDVASWVGDHFFLRQEMISLHNQVSAWLFRTSGNDSVILGSDGWLFYQSTLDDYTGQNNMTRRELFCALRNLELMDAYCCSQGRKFVFVIAPNKNSLYSEYMPDYGVTAAEHDSQRLLILLKQSGVATVDLFNAFSEEGEVLYYATDSHWNARGAALGADLIMDAFGMESSFFDDPFVLSEQTHTGDLFGMIYPALRGKEQNLCYAGQLDFTYVGNATKPDSITLLTEGQGIGTLLAYRDSFGNLLYPYLADSFASARFSRATSYDLTLESDYVLVELVERNLRYLIRNLPVMPSTACALDLPEAAAGFADVSSKPNANAPDGCVLWIGTLTCEPEVDATVYLTTANGAYEAFLTEENGFGIYLPEGEEPEAIVVKSGETQNKYTIN